MVDLGRTTNVRSRGYRAVEGHMIATEAMAVVAAIKDYEPNIHVQWCAPGERKPHQAAYKITMEEPGHEPYVIMHVQHDHEMDARILYRIIAGDQRNGQVKLSDIESAEMATMLLARAEFLDWLEEQEDKVAHIIASHLNTYKVDDNLTIKENIPFNANRLKD